MPVITTYINFPITKNFNLASFFPEVRSVRAAEKPIPNVTVQGLALTSPVSWTINEEQLKSGNANFDEKTGQKGPVSVMAVATYNKIDSGHKEPGNGEKGAKNPAGAGSQSQWRQSRRESGQDSQSAHCCGGKLAIRRQ